GSIIDDGTDVDINSLFGVNVATGNTTVGGTLGVTGTTTLGTANITTGTLTTGTITTLGGAMDANNQAITNVDINSGAIDGTAIGANSASTGSFTTLGTSGSTTLGDNVLLDNLIINSEIQGNLVFEGSNVNGQTITLSPGAAAANATVTLPQATTDLVGHDISQTLTNKSIDADNNTITNIENADIKAAAAIDAAKIANGNVSNTEYQTLDGVASTLTATELNYVDVTTAGAAQASKALVTDASVNVSSINVLGADQLNVNNIRIDGNDISSQDTDGDITLSPNGNGEIVTAGVLRPAGVDATQDLGTSANSFADVYYEGSIQTSDLRLKTNIEPLEYGLEDIERLRAVSYNWKRNENGETNLGLIAQEVLEIIPEAVNVGDDEKQTMGLRYSYLIPVLIKAIQEQQEIINQLMANIEDEKSDKEILKSALDKQMKLSTMHMEMMVKLQSENTVMKSDIDQIKKMLGTGKAANK
ncbi:MAG: tail fiber domain-containing protein, partial [Cyclobacteriaceae bacterium]